MKPVIYRLEIYEPGEHPEVMGSYESEQPLGPFTRGDILDAGTFPNYGRADLEVLRVKHLISEAQDALHHLVMVYTRRPEQPSPDKRAVTSGRFDW